MGLDLKDEDKTLTRSRVNLFQNQRGVLGSLFKARKKEIKGLSYFLGEHRFSRYRLLMYIIRPDLGYLKVKGRTYGLDILPNVSERLRGLKECNG